MKTPKQVWIPIVALVGEPRRYLGRSFLGNARSSRRVHSRQSYPLTIGSTCVVEQVPCDEQSAWWTQCTTEHLHEIPPVWCERKSLIPEYATPKSSQTVPCMHGKVVEVCKRTWCHKRLWEKVWPVEKVELVPKANDQVWCVVAIEKELAAAMQTIGKMPEESERLEALRPYWLSLWCDVRPWPL